MILRATWMNVYQTPMEMYNDLEGFEFVGDGWYQDGKNTAFVQTKKDEGIIFYCFEGFDPRKQLGHLISQPFNGKGRPNGLVQEKAVA